MLCAARVWHNYGLEELLAVPYITVCGLCAAVSATLWAVGRCDWLQIRLGPSDEMQQHPNEGKNQS